MGEIKKKIIANLKNKRSIAPKQKKASKSANNEALENVNQNYRSDSNNQDNLMIQQK